MQNTSTETPPSSQETPSNDQVDVAKSTSTRRRHESKPEHHINDLPILNFDSEQQLRKHLDQEEVKNEFFTGYDDKPYSQIRNNTYQYLGQLDGFDAQRIEDFYNQAHEAAEDLFAFASKDTSKEKHHRTYYHGPNHIEAVLTNNLLIFTALKKISANPEGQPPEIENYLTENFGIDWQTQLRGLSQEELLHTMAYSGLHEVGEWYSRMVSSSAQFQELQDKTRLYIAALSDDTPYNRAAMTAPTTKTRTVHRDNNSAKITFADPIVHAANPDTNDTNKDPNQQYQGWKPFGFDQDNSTHTETAFNLELSWHEEIQPIANFLKPIEFANVPKHLHRIVPLLRIIRASDLLQSWDDHYRQEVNIGTGNNKISTHLGPTLLYNEMEQFMPHALGSYNWDNITDADVGGFFFNTLVRQLNVQDGLLQILDKSGLVSDSNFFTSVSQTYQAEIRSNESS